MEDQKSDPTDETVALAHALIEALTAIGNYLSVAGRIVAEEPPPAQNVLREAVEKSMTQFSRATELARRLTEAIRRGRVAMTDGR